ncbi:MAG: shikimate kinase [Crocinitomicaceae bacterium]|nr:shikimate kinase [Crocinitomicaceae bacterium]
MLVRPIDTIFSRFLFFFYRSEFLGFGFFCTVKIYLVGLSGVGKSSFGKQLSNRLKSSFIDLDQEIEKREGKSIASIFENEGEKHFRKLESAQLRLPDPTHSFVMATGGGTPCFNDNLNYMLDNGIVVYLTLPIAMLASRLVNSYSRPLLGTKGREELEALLAEQLRQREVYYTKAHLSVEMKNMNKERMDAFVKELEARV